LKVYFFPGVGADASLAPYHDLPGHDVEWIRWPAEPGRNWDEFTSALLAENPIQPGAVLIGISFGGMAAQAVASRAGAVGVFLISSCRSSRAVSPWLRPFKSMVSAFPRAFFDMRLMPRVLAGLMFGVSENAHLDLLFSMGSRLEPRRFKRINALALRFDAVDDLGIPVYSIHGGKDRLIPAKGEPHDSVLADGGHLISMTHHEILNRAILQWLGGISAQRHTGSHA
jgi:pimeloyl-ACP methyl ester carboxylesterase